MQTRHTIVLGVSAVVLLGLGTSFASPAPAPAPGLVTVIPARETTHYRITYGMLGQLGELSVDLAPMGDGAASDRVRLVGHGRGSFMGMGEMDKRIVSAFDPLTGSTQCWRNTRTQGGKVTRDTIEQKTPGSITLQRRRDGQAPRLEFIKRDRAVVDPLGFLLRLRLAPPEAGRAPLSLEVLDGRALWRITVTSAAAAPSAGALPFDGTAEPIHWDGSPDAQRTRRTFKLWLSDDAHRTPLRLEMPYGIGSVGVALTSVRRESQAGGFGALSLSRLVRQAELSWWSAFACRPSS